MPNIEKAVTAVDALLGKVKVGNKCVFIGGGQVGCEVAVWLKEQGKHVTVVEALPKLMIGGAEDICIANRLMLIDMLAFNEIDVMLNTKLNPFRKARSLLTAPRGKNNSKPIPLPFPSDFTPTGPCSKHRSRKSLMYGSLVI